MATWPPHEPPAARWRRTRAHALPRAVPAGTQAIAKAHAQKSELNINYLNASPESLDTNLKFDVILNLEVVEHVEDLNLYLSSCSNLIKKGGIMFTATLNRTFVSYIKAIIGAEYILRWLPIGTHDWNKFIKPEELEGILIKSKFKNLETKGLQFNPFYRSWSKSNNHSVNYIMVSEKI